MCESVGVMPTAKTKRVVARYLTAMWDQGTSYAERLRLAVERHGAKVRTWRITDHGNVSSILMLAGTADEKPRWPAYL